MKKFIIALALLFMAIPAQAQSLNNSAVLAGDPGFLQRVKQAMISAATSISNEGSGVTLHASRDTIVVLVLGNPNQWAQLFAYAAANDATVLSGATQNSTVTLTANGCTGDYTAPWPSCTGGSVVNGNVSTQSPLATDTAISNAVSADWNSFFQH